MQESEISGKMYPVATYTEADEVGVGVIVSASSKARTSAVPCTLTYPVPPTQLTLWSTDRSTQIYYRAVRMLGNVAMPGVLMGVPFVGEQEV